MIITELITTQTLIYQPMQFVCSTAQFEPESTEYAGARFQLNHLNICFRVAKITPTKIGQFVTLWKRSQTGPIQPFDSTDDIDLVVICTRFNQHFGQFVFPKATLIKQDIMSVKNKGGKRAIRVYPPWDRTESRQAQKTQSWQLDYFLDLSETNKIDYDRVKKLYE